ncbi:MAG: glycosyltransferase family 4 protein [Rhodospirillales bacterium]|nr:glycosyltransferase family 4 protein [Rhodospirillales bacterium]
MTRIDIDFSLAMHNRTGRFFIGRDLIETPGLPLGDVYYWRLRSPPRGLVRRVVGRLQRHQVEGRTLGGRLGWLPPRRPSRSLLHLDPYTVPSTELRRSDIVLCHDVGPVTHPHLFAPAVGAIYREIYRLVAATGPHMVFVSQASRRGFERLHPAACPTSSRVIYPAIRTDLSAQMARRPEGIEAPFLLTVGSIGERKNQARSIAAFARSGLALRGLRYVLCGAREPGFERVAAAAAQAEGVVLLPYVADAELAWLYANAAGFVLASQLEGFAMPVAEAAAHGLVPLVSTGGVLEEVAGDGALVADPEDETDIAARMVALAHMATDEKAERQRRLATAVARFDLARVQAEWLRAFTEWSGAPSDARFS